MGMIIGHNVDTVSADTVLVFDFNMFKTFITVNPHGELVQP